MKTLIAVILLASQSYALQNAGVSNKASTVALANNNGNAENTLLKAVEDAVNVATTNAQYVAVVPYTYSYDVVFDAVRQIRRKGYIVSIDRLARTLTIGWGK